MFSAPVNAALTRAENALLLLSHWADTTYTPEYPVSDTPPVVLMRPIIGRAVES